MAPAAINVTIAATSVNTDLIDFISLPSFLIFIFLGGLGFRVIRYLATLQRFRSFERDRESDEGPLRGLCRANSRYRSEMVPNSQGRTWPGTCRPSRHRVASRYSHSTSGAIQISRTTHQPLDRRP